jgi:hypothetical protein
VVTDGLRAYQDTFNKEFYILNPKTMHLRLAGLRKETKSFVSRFVLLQSRYDGNAYKQSALIEPEVQIQRSNTSGLLSPTPPSAL